MCKLSSISAVIKRAEREREKERESESRPIPTILAETIMRRKIVFVY